MPKTSLVAEFLTGRDYSMPRLETVRARGQAMSQAGFFLSATGITRRTEPGAAYGKQTTAERAKALKRTRAPARDARANVGRFSGKRPHALYTPVWCND